MTQTAYIIDAVRTPVGKRNGALSTVRPDDMLAHCIRSLMQKNPQVEAKEIDDVVIGCAFPEAQQGLNVARISAMLAGLPDTVPAYTINRFCASGLQAVANAAAMIESGAADVVIAGGTESMSQIPMTGNTPMMNIKIFDDNQAGLAYGMGLTAEKVVAKYGISQAEQNQFALSSHHKAHQAQGKGDFDDEISPIQVCKNIFDETQDQKVSTTLEISQDEGIRKDTTIEALNQLKGAFHSTGTVTAGNSSQMSDGAGAVLLVSEEFAKTHQLKPQARFINYQVAGVPPEIMGIGPIKSIPKALKKANITLQEVDWIELNEAFAAQSLAVIKELDIDANTVNPQGGAIALGHPLGATGAIRTATLMSAFKRHSDIRYGMITMCIGAGMGATGIFENL